MPRNARTLVDGAIYHVLNRGNGQQQVFYRDSDYLYFKVLLSEAKERYGFLIYAYCLMPNHFHLAVKVDNAQDMSRAMQWVMTKHVLYHQKQYQTSGHIWQGRYKDFVVSNDAYLITLMRYIEANPVRAELVESCQQWPWSSHAERFDAPKRLVDCSLELPKQWTNFVDQALDNNELGKIRTCIKRRSPYGEQEWVEEFVKEYGLETTIRAIGRPSIKK